MNLKLFMPYAKQKARFENICYKVILFSTGNFERNLRTIVGVKLCHALFRG